MKTILSGLILLLTLNANAASIECYQGDGDDRYDLKYNKGLLAIVHTNDRDESDLLFYDSADYFASTKTISADRYIVNLSKDLRNFSSLYKLEGRKKVLLTDLLECHVGHVLPETRFTLYS